MSSTPNLTCIESSVEGLIVEEDEGEVKKCGGVLLGRWIILDNNYINDNYDNDYNDNHGNPNSFPMRDGFWGFHFFLKIISHLF